METTERNRCRPETSAAFRFSACIQTAQKACRSILPGPTNAEQAAQAQQQRAHGQDILAFARCLRSRGVSEFPDPNSQGQAESSAS
jgi:hypothetical protein